ncbi:hypothetical protein YK48G_00750 [Lentilactobacillus fungorum]|uniref:Prepilin-type N-terminal cleavage/methylation domain-containing protein n=1 Tax=Lentilactobacillus fungorum TaxID=2201250 RepID=A0ABQ3VUS6_9LACO|nr:hypothetical protein [Lentilactobacillus fungorum]GHP12650.1 hypothetical protein YK48G_00750 [Lentilactobacillus fungorum]
MKLLNKSAFTLIELIVYLGIIVSVLLLNLILIKVVKLNNPAETIFWESVDSAWNEMTITSQIYHTGYQVQFWQNRLIFIPSDKRLKRKIISYPTDLQIVQFVSFKVSDDGFVAPRTVHWYSKDGREKYQQKIQLGWSGYRLKKTN